MKRAEHIRIYRRPAPDSRNATRGQRFIWNLDWQEMRLPSRARQGAPAFLRNHTADLLTLLRVGLGLFLVILASAGGALLARDIWVLVLAWSTDMVDGWIARSLGRSGQSRLGKHDVYVDMFFSAAVLAYLVITGLLPPGIAAMYTLLWGAVILNWGIPPLFAQAFQNPIYLYFVVLTFLAAPAVVPWLLLWALASLALFWRRLVDLARQVSRQMAGRAD